MHFQSAPEKRLEGDFDLESGVGRLPAAMRTKGMFFTRLVEKLGPRWRDVAKTLEAAPRFGRYVPFSDYPGRDHLRVIDAAARIAMPTVATREGHRRLGQTVIAEFAQSTLGGIVMKLVNEDVTTALLKFPETYAMVVKPTPPVHATVLEGGGVRIVYENVPAGLEYVLGTLEGIVLHFGRRPTVDVTAGTSGVFELRW